MIVKKKKLILGTALWGWTVDTTGAESLLDAFYAAGGRCVDTAGNYPINGNPDQFRAAETMLAAWLKKNGISDMEVIAKVGSIDNSGSPANNLAPSFLLMNLDYYRGVFGSNLYSLMIHWDNRNDPGAVAGTAGVFPAFVEAGIRPGLSGIQHPELYFDLSEIQKLTLPVECKYNLFHDGIGHYSKYLDRAEMLLYGLTGGGLKFGEEYRPDSSAAVRSVDAESKKEVLGKLEKLVADSPAAAELGITGFHHLSLLHGWFEDRAAGIILGPSRRAHLEDSLGLIERMENNPKSRELHDEVCRAAGIR